MKEMQSSKELLSALNKTKKVTGRRILSVILCLAMIMSAVMPVVISLFDAVTATADEQIVCTHSHTQECASIPDGHTCSTATGCIPVFPYKTVVVAYGHSHTDSCFMVTGGYTHGGACYDEEGELVCGSEESAGVSTLICSEVESDDVTVTEPDTEAAPISWTCYAFVLSCEHAWCSSDAQCFLYEPIIEEIEPLEEQIINEFMQFSEDGTTILNWIVVPGSSPTDVVIPVQHLPGVNITAIARGAFANAGLTSVTFMPGSQITSIGASAFSNNFLNNQHLMLPASVNNIGDRAFERTNIVGITIPNEDVSFGIAVFENCAYLQSIDFRHMNITGIPSSMFNNNTSLSNVLLPAGLINIGSLAFHNTTSLTQISLPSSLTILDNFAFARTGLTSVDFRNTNVRTLPGGAFDGSRSLQTVNLRDDHQSIGASAFLHNTSLTTINFPSSLTSIGRLAFSGCTSLIGVDLRNTQLTTISEGTFSNSNTPGIGAMQINEMLLPETLTTIEFNAFRGNSQLRNIRIPASVNAIGYDAFLGMGTGGMIDLREHAPGSITGAPWGATITGTNPTIIQWRETPENTTMFEFDPTTGIIYGIKTDHPSYSATWLNLVIPASITVGGTAHPVTGFTGDAFSVARTALRTVSFAPGSQVREIPANAFDRSTSLTTVTLPPGLEIIGTSAFENCSALQTVTLPASLRSIGQFAFRNCNALANVNFHEATSLREIGSGAFSSTGALTTITFPPNLETVGSTAFYGQRNLTSVTFTGSAINTINLNAFGNCDNLTSIRFNQKARDSVSGRPWGARNAFVYWSDHNYMPDQITVGDWVFNPNTNTITEYIGTAANVVVPPSLTYDGVSYQINRIRSWPETGMARPIMSARQLTSLTISPGISIVGATAFQGVTIGTINLGTVETIENNVFSGSGATTVTWSSNLVSIGEGAFRNNNLTSLNLPVSVTTIRANAFEGNNLAGEIIIPRNVTFMGLNVFAGNGNITVINVHLFRRQESAGTGPYNVARPEVRDTMPWGTSLNPSTHIRYMDDPAPNFRHRIIPDPSTNTVKIEFEASMLINANFNQMVSGTGMPALSNIYLAPATGPNQWSSADMHITHTHNGNSTYEILVRFFGNLWDSYQVEIDNFKYSVLYHGNGHTAGTVPVDNGRYILDAKTTLAGQGNLVRGNYVILGWTKEVNPAPIYTQAEFNAIVARGEFYSGEYTFKDGDTPVNLYAVWGLADLIPDGHLVTFDPRPEGQIPGEGLGVGEAAVRDIISGNTIGSEMPLNPTRPGHTFLGWYEDDGTPVVAGTVVDREINAKAEWIPTSGAKLVKELANILEYPDVTAGEIHIHYTISYTLPENIHRAKALVVEDIHDNRLSLIGGGVSGRIIGGTFDMSGVPYAASGNTVRITIPADKFTEADAGRVLELTLRFRAADTITGTIRNESKVSLDLGDGEKPIEPVDPDDPKVTLHVVTFDANNGTFSDGTTIKRQIVEHGKAAIAPYPLPTRLPGFTFTEWNRPFNNIVEPITVQAGWVLGDRGTINVFSKTSTDANKEYIPGQTTSYNVSFTLPANVDTFKSVRIEDNYDSNLSSPRLTGLTVNGVNVLNVPNPPALDNTYASLNITNLVIPRALFNANDVVVATIEFNVSINARDTIHNNARFLITYLDDVEGPGTGGPGTPGEEKLECKEHEVTFNPGPGAFPDKDPGDKITVDVKHGDDLEGKIPSDPTRPGYDFGGWEDEDGKPVDETTVIVDDKEVTAKWNLATYTITYVVGEGTNPAANPNTYNVEQLPLDILDPTRPGGYRFRDWTVTGSDGDTVTTIGIGGNIPANTTGNLTLTANWILGDIVPPDTFTKISTDENKEYVPGTDTSFRISVTLPDDVAGYRSIRIVDTYDAKLSNPRLLSVTRNGTALPLPTLVVNTTERTASFTLPETMFSADDVIVATIVFFVAADARDEITNTARFFITPREGDEFPSVGGPNTPGEEKINCKVNKVTFDPTPAGQIPGLGVGIPAERDIPHGNTIGNEMPQDPTRPDHIFVGWYESDGKPVDKDTVVDRPIDAVAAWIPTSGAKLVKELANILEYPEAPAGFVHIHYTISYTLPENIHRATSLVVEDIHDSRLSLIGGGVSGRIIGGTFDMSGVPYAAAGNTVRIEIPADKFTAADAGRVLELTLRFRAVDTITGTIRNESKVSINPGDGEVPVLPVDPEDPKVTLHVVTFDSNGGTFSDGTTTKRQIVEEGKDATAPSPLPTRPGYVFTQWDRAFNNIVEPITVRAQWSNVPVISEFSKVSTDANKVYTPGEPTSFVITARIPASIDSIASVRIEDNFDENLSSPRLTGLRIGGAAVPAADWPALITIIDGSYRATNLILPRTMFNANDLIEATIEFNVDINARGTIYNNVRFLITDTEGNEGPGTGGPGTPGEEKLECKEHEVTFNPGPGTFDGKDPGEPIIVDVKHGDDLEGKIPSDPTRPGYDFGGWEDEDGRPVDETTVIEDDKEVTAKWNLVTYTITYVVGEGTNPAANPNTYNVEQLPLDILDPTRPAYTFAGWTVTGSVGNTVTTIGKGGSIPANTTGNLTLTANWIFGDIVEPHPDNFTKISTDENKEYVPGTDTSFRISVTLPDDVAGYSSIRIVDTYDEKLSNPRLLSVTRNGTALPLPNLVVNTTARTASFTLPNTMFSADDVIVATIVFFVAADARDEITNTARFFITPREGDEIPSVGGPNTPGEEKINCGTNKVTFDPGTAGQIPGLSVGVPAERDIPHGDTIGNEMPQDPTRPGHIFVGWYESDGKPVDKDTVVDRDIIAEAAWIPTSGAKLEKELANILEYPDVAAGQIHIHYTISYELPANIGLADYVIIEDRNNRISDMNFLGATIRFVGGANWDSNMMTGVRIVLGDDGVLRAHIPGSKFSASDTGRVLELTMRFRAADTITGTIRNDAKLIVKVGDKEEPIDPIDPIDPVVILHVVTFDANEGTFSDGTTIKTQIVEEGKAATAPYPLPTRPGYIFTQWDRAFNNITAPITVQAQWSNVPVISEYSKVSTDANKVYTPGEPTSFVITARIPANMDTIESVRIEDNFDSNLSSPRLTGLRIGGAAVPAADWPALITIIDGSYRATNLILPRTMFNASDLIEVTLEFNVDINARGTISNNARFLITDTEGTEGPGVGGPGTPGEEKLECKEHEVTFNPGPGTFPGKDHGEPIIVDVKHGDDLEGKIPTNPTRPGYDFGGWEDEDGRPVDETTVIEDDKEVTAKWNLVTYTITYAVGEGTNPAANPNTYNVEQLPLEILDPTRPAYTFRDWTVTGSVGNTVTTIGKGGSIPAGTTGNLTLTANWTFGDIVEPHPDNFTKISTDANKEYVPGTDTTFRISVTLPDDVAGYESIRIEDTYDEKLSNPRLTSVTRNGTAIPLPNLVVNTTARTASFTLPRTMFSADDVIVATIVFFVAEDARDEITNTARFFITPLVGDEIPSVGGPNTPGEEKLTCKENKVTFAPGPEGQIPGLSVGVPAERDIPHGNTIGNEMPQDPTRPGHIFVGWYESDGKPVDKDTVVDRDINAEAAWIPTSGAKLVKELANILEYPDVAAGQIHIHYTISYELPANIGLADYVIIEDRNNRISDMDFLSATIRFVGGANWDNNMMTGVRIVLGDDGVLRAHIPGSKFSATDTGRVLELTLRFRADDTITGTIRNDAKLIVKVGDKEDPIDPIDPIDPVVILHTVTFDANEGTFSDGTTTKTQLVEEGKAATAPYPLPTRLPGYKFTEWDRAFNNIVAPITVKAQWVLGDTETIDIFSKTSTDANKEYIPGQTTSYNISFTLPADVDTFASVRIEDNFDENLSSPRLTGLTRNGVNVPNPPALITIIDGSYRATNLILPRTMFNANDVIELTLEFTVDINARGTIYNNARFLVTDLDDVEGPGTGGPGGPGEEKLECKEHEVTFDPGPGTFDGKDPGDEITVDVKHGDDLEGKIPSDPTRPGYDFGGWEDENGNTVDETTVIEDDLEVTAKWNLVTYTITYVVGEGMNPAANPNTYNIEQLPLNILDPTRQAYTFRDWTVTGSVGNTVTTIGKGGSIPAGTTGNLTLTANWILGDIKEPHPDNFTKISTDENKEYIPGTDTSFRISVTLPDDVAGYSSIRIEDTYDAKLSNPRLLSVTRNGTALPLPTLVVNETARTASFTLPESMFSADDVIVATIVFFVAGDARDEITNTARFFITPREGDEFPSVGGPNTPGEEKLTRKENKVTFDPGTDGRIPGLDVGVPAERDIPHGDTIGNEMPQDPTRPDHIFVGWYESDGKPVDKDTVVDRPIDAEAVWIPTSGTRVAKELANILEYPAVAAGEIHIHYAISYELPANIGLADYVIIEDRNSRLADMDYLGSTIRFVGGGNWDNNMMTGVRIVLDTDGVLRAHIPGSKFSATDTGRVLELTVRFRAVDTMTGTIRNDARLIVKVGDKEDPIDPIDPIDPVVILHTVAFDANEGTFSDGTSIKSQFVEEGKGATAPSPNPTRPGYEFNNWDRPFANITEPITVKAQWTPVTYGIVYVVGEGNNPANNPTSYNAEQLPLRIYDPTRTGYTFTGWTVTGSVGNTLTVIPVGGNIPENTIGNLTLTANWHFGGYTHPAPEDFIKTSTERDYIPGGSVTYNISVTLPQDIDGYAGLRIVDNYHNNLTNPTLTNLTVNGVPVTPSALNITTGNRTVNVRLDRALFNAGDQITATLAFDVLATATGVITNAARFYIIPLDGSGDVPSVGDTETITLREYTVTFLNWNGDLLSVQTIPHGGSAVAPSVPTRTGWEHTGWNPSNFANITSNLTVVAQYSPMEHTVTFVDWNGTVLRTQTVPHGGSAVAPANPTRTGFIFTSWSLDFTNVQHNLRVEARYTPNTYTVLFVDWNGVVLSTQSVQHGGNATAPVSPSRTGFTFAGWSPGFTNVMSNLTITAQYTALGAPPPPPPPPPIIITPPAPPPPAPPPIIITPPGGGGTTPPTIIVPPAPAPAPEPEIRFEAIPDADPPTGAMNGETEIPSVTIGDDDVPLFAGEGSRNRVWALWNLILSVAGVVLTAMLLIRILIQKRREDDPDRAEDRYNDDEKEKKTRRTRLLMILAVPILAIIAIVIFILTQDMRNLMVLVDWWTLAHVVIFAGAIICYIFAFKRKRDEDEYYDGNYQYEAN